ncbi:MULTISPECIES: aminoglycoside phosphotransferase family protein [Nocardiopsis]|uniref:Hydroxyurea phosphotransferase n=1 Tax=Nocardiopsis sinuspersici TaxID=501010 RepID=A0A1V3BZX0_9ACTN|nr:MULTISPECIES: aminoglycoside phosphotransferase family protein [Nocardiopsis]OOC53786.1 hydroxyurea phosphotransferase [Nocardiopsis sinuspersici]
MRESTPPVPMPEELARTVSGFFGPEWVDRLPRTAARQCDLWRLRPTGDRTLYGAVSLVLPVRCADGTPAVLKVLPVDQESEGEPDALRIWAGDGAVRLLAHDPGSGALLLEALDPDRSLDGVEVDRALTVIGGLLARLNAHPGPTGMRSLGPITRALVERARPFLAHERLDHRFRRLLARWTAVAREMAAQPGDRLLHWDLHFQNVLAPLPGTGREPWVAIDPKPLVGDPGYELLPALRNRFAEEADPGGEARSVRHRFDLLTEAAGIDRGRARAWTLVRVLEDCVWRLESGNLQAPHPQVVIGEAVAD